jgi:flap endonuclease-1
LAVQLGSLVAGVKESITFDDLADRTIAVDAFNTIYQFITIIRGPDGTPLMDSKGRVTSHLSGLFYRTISMLEHKITPVFVFDGIPPLLKRRTIEARMKHRQDAEREWGKALEKGMLEEARAHAVQSSRITKDMIESAKELLTSMGIAYIQAPSEGEAQAARMTREGLVYASASQDYDLFLFGSDVAIRNLTISGRRKLPSKNVFIDIMPERIELKKLLESLAISRKQLIWLGMLMGTDFNDGIPKVGPKTALKIVREHTSLGEIVAYVKEKYNTEFEVDPVEIEQTFENPDTSEMSKEEMEKILAGAKPNRERVVKFMCDEHDFSEERIGKFADTLMKLRSKSGQKGIGSWTD